MRAIRFSTMPRELLKPHRDVCDAACRAELFTALLNAPEAA